MGRCIPLDEKGIRKLGVAFQDMKSPPQGHDVVIAPHKILGGNFAGLVDRSVTAFQSDGWYCVHFKHGIEELRYVCKIDSGYTMRVDTVPGYPDQVFTDLSACIVGKVVRSLTLFQ